MPLIPATPDPAMVQNLDLRCRVLEIDKEVALWRCEKYRELLLGGSGDSIGHSAAERTIVSSSSHSGLASGSTALQQQPLLPGLVAQQDDEGRAHHQRSVFAAAHALDSNLPIDQNISTLRNGAAQGSAP